MVEPERLGKYEIQGVLGRGAMGVVYKGFDPVIQRIVAIKTVIKERLDHELAAQLVARFKNEARAAGRLLHPNIVGVYEYGEDEGTAYIAMEYVEGAGLRAHLTLDAERDLGQILAIMTQLLSALDFAHERGVIHRDIKPSNLILTKDGVLKVADFGIARVDASVLTHVGTVMGTPSYMSPEQWQGRPIDRRSDLFSAGVVLYELLTCERPFVGTLETIAYRTCTQDPPAPSAISRLKLSPAIDAVVNRALAKQPEARFQTALEFSRALQQACDAEAAGRQALEAPGLDLTGVRTQVAAAPVWDDTVVRTAERQLAQFVGPMAKVVVRKAAARTSDLAELYAQLSESIPNLDLRRRFVDGARTTVNPGSRSPSDPGTGGSRPNPVPQGTRTGPARSPSASPPLEQAFLDQTAAKLAVYLGPIAKVVVKRAAAEAESQQEFVRIVASPLATRERDAFLREIGFPDA